MSHPLHCQLCPQRVLRVAALAKYPRSLPSVALRSPFLRKYKSACLEIPPKSHRGHASALSATKPFGRYSHLAPVRTSATRWLRHRRHVFRVRPVNAAGAAPWSPPSNRASVRGAPPGAPAALRADSAASTSAVLSWDPPASDGGVRIGAYHVEVAEYRPDRAAPLPPASTGCCEHLECRWCRRGLAAAVVDAACCMLHRAWCGAALAS